MAGWPPSGHLGNIQTDGLSNLYTHIFDPATYDNVRWQSLDQQTPSLQPSQACSDLADRKEGSPEPGHWVQGWEVCVCVCVCVVCVCVCVWGQGVGRHGLCMHLCVGVRGWRLEKL